MTETTLKQGRISIPVPEDRVIHRADRESKHDQVAAIAIVFAGWYFR